MVTILGQGKDAKGIELKITYNDISLETTVTVWKENHVLKHIFKSNRFKFYIADSVKALQTADFLAEQIEKELKL